MADLNKLDEEFNNFMLKVTEVSEIINKLASNDQQLQAIGNLEAKQYLGEDRKNIETKIGKEDNVELKFKNDRTIINKVALHKDDNPQTQSKEAFMDEISKDANRRYRDKLRRKERMETLRKQGNLAFRRGEFEKALTLYTKATEEIKDNCTLYCNRALTFINLKIYDSAISDIEWALKINENSLKAQLLLIKIYHLTNDYNQFIEAIDNAKLKNPKQISFIEDYIKELKQ